jgi:hypothetical protein
LVNHSEHDDKFLTIHSFPPFSSPLVGIHDHLTIPIYDEHGISIMNSEGKKFEGQNKERR